MTPPLQSPLEYAPSGGMLEIYIHRRGDIHRYMDNELACCWQDLQLSPRRLVFLRSGFLGSFCKVISLTQ